MLFLFFKIKYYLVSYTLCIGYLVSYTFYIGQTITLVLNIIQMTGKTGKSGHRALKHVESARKQENENVSQQTALDIP